MQQLRNTPTVTNYRLCQNNDTMLVLVFSLVQRRSQEFDLGGYKWVKERKQPHKKF